MNGSVSHPKDKHGRKSRLGDRGHEFRLRHIQLELPSKDPGEDAKSLLDTWDQNPDIRQEGQRPPASRCE